MREVRKAGALGVFVDALDERAQEKLKPLHDSIVNYVTKICENNNLTLHEAGVLNFTAELTVSRRIEEQKDRLNKSTLFKGAKGGTP